MQGVVRSSEGVVTPAESGRQKAPGAATPRPQVTVLRLSGPFQSQVAAHANVVAKNQGCVGLDSDVLDQMVDPKHFERAKATVKMAEVLPGLVVLPVLCDPDRGMEVALLPTYRDASGRVWVRAIASKA